MKKMRLNIQLFASGESSVFTDSPLQMKIKWSSTPSEDVQNASDVTCEIYGRRTSGSTKGRQWNGYMNIGGNIHNFSQIYTKTSTTISTSWVLIAYYTDTIVHDNDGTKTITIYGGLGGPSGTSLANNWCEGSTTATLDQLASPATLNSVNIDNFVSQGKFTPYFTENQQGLYYGIGIISYTPIELIVSWNNTIAVSNGVEATLTDAQKQTLWNVLDSKDNRTANDIKFILYSFTDSARTDNIGGTDVSFENVIKIPNYSLNFDWNTTTIYDGNASQQYGGHDLSYYAGNKYVKGLSKPVVSFSAYSSTGYLYGKTITYTLNGVARTSPYEDSGWSDGDTYTITASDGRTSPITTTITINVVNYFVPYLSNIRVVRPIPTDDIVRVSYTANYYDGTGLSNLTNAVYNFYYRESESDAWVLESTLSGTSTSGSQTFSNVDIDNLNYKKPFYYKIEFTDRIGNTTQVYPYTSNIPKGLPVWNAYVDSNDDNVLNVNGNETIDGDLSVSGSLGVDELGRMKSLELGGIYLSTPFIDFHYDNDFSVDYTSRIIEVPRGTILIDGKLNTTGGVVSPDVFMKPISSRLLFYGSHLFQKNQWNDLINTYGIANGWGSYRTGYTRWARFIAWKNDNVSSGVGLLIGFFDQNDNYKNLSANFPGDWGTGQNERGQFALSQFMLFTDLNYGWNNIKTIIPGDSTGTQGYLMSLTMEVFDIPDGINPNNYA